MFTSDTLSKRRVQAVINVSSPIRRGVSGFGRAYMHLRSDSYVPQISMYPVQARAPIYIAICSSKRHRVQHGRCCVRTL
jgi:hypothetical protein